MLERLVAWVLNNYLGKYVENLNTDQLSIAILQGEVELENLPLKKDALRHVGLPIQIEAGYVGKVKLQIPVAQFRSAPWVILIEQLCLVLGPVKLSEWDEEAEEQAAQEYKLAQLDALEARWRAERESSEASSYYATSYSSWLSLGTNLVADIVENLQLKIKDVHIRYEDDETIPGQAFVFGITIGTLSAQSCDDKWMPRFVGRETGQTSFKLMELSDLSVYCDSLSKDQLLGRLALGELAVAMSKCLSQNHQYVLSPVSAQAHVKRNKSDQPLRSRTQPRIVCDLHLEEVLLSLTDWQYGQMVGCVKGLLRINKCCGYRRFRPSCSVKKNPKAWWLYAATCHVKSLQRSVPCDVSSALKRAKENIAYIDMYCHILTNPAGALTPDKKILKDTVELSRGFEELRSLREIAMRKVRPPEKETPTSTVSTRRSLLHWFPYMWGWNYTTVPADATTTPLTAEQQLEDEILDAIADTVENNTLLRRDTVFGQFNLTLKKGVFNLCTVDKNTNDTLERVRSVIVLEFENMVIGLESRPRSGSHKFYVTLGAMFLRDQLTRDTAFPVLVGPQFRDSVSTMLGRGIASVSRTRLPTTDKKEDPLFNLTYEYKPFHSSKDYRLHIITRSLEIVYNPGAIKWLVDFFMKPHQAPDAQLRLAARSRYEAMKLKTKQEFIKNWEQILEGGVSDRKTWDIELDISAPQIMFVEHFCDKNALIVLVDFGKFHFCNQINIDEHQAAAATTKDSDDEDEFQTPCSTPPGSEASLSESHTMQSFKGQDLSSSFTDLALHHRLYDRYTMDLGDLQILVGRVKDNWKYAHVRGTSTLHVLDRFSISLQLERRVVYTADPQFPSLMLSGNLPKLVVHVNEQKIDGLRTMATLVANRGLPSPFRSQEANKTNLNEAEDDTDAVSMSEATERSVSEMSRLVMLQFTIDHMSLEVQSRGRSVAELQVSGVRSSYTKRPYDTSVSLSVHSLLLVDALQTFGPDFELLVASHKHVGMDSVSGSLRDSEPTSPTSPASPDPSNFKSLKDTSPVAISQALSNLQSEKHHTFRAVSPTEELSSPKHASSPHHNISIGRPPSIGIDMLDAEALIVIEVMVVSPNCPSNGGSNETLQIASVQFNNLDIIANQETIVELVGFVRRVFPQLKPKSRKPLAPPPTLASSLVSLSGLDDPLEIDVHGVPNIMTRTELTFDFHRLNVLLLRAVLKDGVIVGRKVGTATMSEAKIQATVGQEISVQGSLGGLQVLDLTPEGQKHQRILSLGKDPLTCKGSLNLLDTLNAELYTMGQHTCSEDNQAFSFTIKKVLFGGNADCPEIKLRMASVWYTHSTQFLAELQSCATEFKQYLSNLAQSIKTAATEMALGLVHARAEALAQGLYRNTRLSSSIGTGSMWEMSPRRRRKSWSLSYEQLESIASTKGTTPHTPHSPSMEDDFVEILMDFRLDIVLETPVVVLPRSSSSSQVFVAHLGKITMSNTEVSTPQSEEQEDMWGMSHRERYHINIRDMNLYSLDVEKRLAHSLSGSECNLMRAERLYSCVDSGKPILHDTAISLSIDRYVGRSVMKNTDSFQSLLLGEDYGADFLDLEIQEAVNMSGSVVTPLRVSLSRNQYEQLIDAINNVLSYPTIPETIFTNERRLGNIEEEETGLVLQMSSSKLEQASKTKMTSMSSSKIKTETQQRMTLKVDFQLPVFTVELRSDVGLGEQGLVDLSFQDFVVNYNNSQRFETVIQMSLRSLLMEDLLREPDSKYRCIVISSALPEPGYPHSVYTPEFVSTSCPDLLTHPPLMSAHGSLPDHLETQRVYGAYVNGKNCHQDTRRKREKAMEYPCTPPPSPRPCGSFHNIHKEDNLVHINVLLVDPNASNFATHYNSVRRSVNVDFNCLDVVVNAESWVVVLDFFGFGSSDSASKPPTNIETHQLRKEQIHTQEPSDYNSGMDIEIRSLNLVLNRPKYEVAKVNISNFKAKVSSRPPEQTIEGTLGSMSLTDLTMHGQLYREKFVTSGLEALNFKMIRHIDVYSDVDVSFDTKLQLEMSSVLYVHTQRFVAEILEFFNSFSQLQGVVESIRAAAGGGMAPQGNLRKSRFLLELNASAPVILLPVSSQSEDILVVDLGKLTVNNSFKYAGSVGTISHSKMCINYSNDEKDGENHRKVHDSSYTAKESTLTAPPCLLDVMRIDLDNMDLYAGRREQRYAPQVRRGSSLELGSFCVSKQGPSLLQKKCHLNLQVDRNLDVQVSRAVPDMSVKGTLSTLQGALDLFQYNVIKGLLSYNIGENLDDIPSSTKNSTENKQFQVGGSSGRVWTLFSLHLDLLNVTLKLQLSHGCKTSGIAEASLACINFIKSRLMLETFSNNTRDVDLVSQEILITDTRYQAEPVNKRSNVFTNILQPINVTFGSETVQAEVHHRRKPGKSKFTILLNNMRLMAIVDWWEAIRDFILGEDKYQPTEKTDAVDIATVHTTVTTVPSEGIITKVPQPVDAEDVSLEMKLNITDSEIVVVEDTSQWDSSSVILKSTTVISYQPNFVDKPLSCNLNHCEMFSCILGMEDETALSIIDPVTVNMEVSRKPNLERVRGLTDAMLPASADRVLEIQLQHLSVRLSYHDMMMFIRILNSLPKQTQWARRQESVDEVKPANVLYQINKLAGLGFHPNDCSLALDNCNGQLDEAALWLTQNAVPVNSLPRRDSPLPEIQSKLSFQLVEIHTNCLSICVIDDCRDADVPLVELSLSQLHLQQELVSRTGSAECSLTGDYYNRILSGWEPFIEPWKCELSWHYSMSQSLTRNRLNMHISAQDILSVNLTRTLIDLYCSVKENWTQEYYSRERIDPVTGRSSSSPCTYRRRSPFVPFALRNDTGCKLWFKTLITATDNIQEDTPTKQILSYAADGSWLLVGPKETVPFNFEVRGKARHQDTHKLRLHQICVKVNGWHPVSPVSVDRVGIYFRHAPLEDQPGLHVLGPARVVFDVTLEGSARKLVTVRSALLIHNQLQESVDVRLDTTTLHGANLSSKNLLITPGSTVPVPLSHVVATMYVRPVDKSHPHSHNYVFCNKPILWSKVTKPGEIIEELQQCHGNREYAYRFCTSIYRENYPVDKPTGPLGTPIIIQPAHIITLRPPVTICNLLPYDLHYFVKGFDTLKGHIKPGLSSAIHQVDMEKPVELFVYLENISRPGLLVIPPNSTSFSCFLKLHDAKDRRLFLDARVSIITGVGVKVYISAPFWIINKTALPLVFRQEGVPSEAAAGQFEEHEIARMVAPLLFSFADQEASPTVVARVGNELHPSGIPQWCKHFHLQKGIQVRRLRVSLRDNRPDIMYEVGINVRAGKGRYRFTNIVTLSPKFQLHNKSSYQLQFSQKCFATTLMDPGAQETYLRAVPGCCLAFHWPRLDKDQQLCVRLVDVPDCLWSGGFLIDTNDSRHINIRDTSGRMYFLRVEVVLQGATNFVVFNDADTIPPPVRIDNYSEVPLQFYQSSVVAESLHTVVRPHLSMPYAWDEPTQPHCITLVAPGGVTALYDMRVLEKSGDARDGPSLTYENFIYICFTATFRHVPENGDVHFDPLHLESQQLVLDVPPNTCRIILSRKIPGARSQLWRMTGDGQLQHEGSSPPRDPRSKHSSDPDALVLDIAGPAPQPTQYVNLVLRRKDRRRKSTQTWRFTEEGRLCCIHNNMCVQAKDGFFGMHEGSEAVLGPPQPVCHQLTASGIPVEQAVSRQKLRPGSGFLTVRMMTDGPTAVLYIADLKEKPAYVIGSSFKKEGITPSPHTAQELEITVDLPCGVGISLVSRKPPEELVFIQLTGILLELISTAIHQTLNLTVQHIQCDNQLFEAQCPVVVYITPPSTKSSKESRFLPALNVALERMLVGRSPNCENFKYLIVTIKNLTVIIEELLLLKLFAFASYNHTDSEYVEVDESDFETQRILTEVTSVHAKKYYFGLLKLEPGQVRLSVMTTNKLPQQFQSIKRKLGLTLIKFEDANVDLKPFVKHHPFESGQFFVHSILKKYKDELKWQAAVILGSVDFLGNPLGLVSDFAEGVSELIYDGNVQSLVQNVSYGLSNSAAKVTESLSDGLGRMIMDEQHEETRQKIRKVHTGSSGEHLVAGLKGLGFGILGGVTSVFRQTYEGAANEGIQGFISGFGKGLVGTVTKPVVGVLDLASETASAVRDSSRSAKHLSPPRFHPPRCVIGPRGLLPHYSKKQSQGQEFLYNINHCDYSELFIAYEYLRSGSEDLRILISSERIRVFTVSSSGNHMVVIETHLNDLIYCKYLNFVEDGSSSISLSNNKHYIEIAMKVDASSSGVISSQEPIKRPKVRCDNEPVAKWVTQQVNYAKGMYEERRNTLISYRDGLLED